MKWISVKDRLPEEDGYYLTYCIDNGANQYMDIQRFNVDGRIETGIYSNPKIYWSNQKWDDNIVTDWMPLPEPPK